MLRLVFDIGQMLSLLLLIYGAILCLVTTLPPTRAAGRRKT